MAQSNVTINHPNIYTEICQEKSWDLEISSTKLPVVSCQRVAIRRSLPQIGSQRSVKSLDSEIAPTDAVGNAYRMNQRRVRVLPRSESRRGEYAAKPHLPYRNKLKKYGELLYTVVQQFAMRIDVLRRHAYRNCEVFYLRLISAQVVANFPTGSTASAPRASSKKLFWSFALLG